MGCGICEASQNFDHEHRFDSCRQKREHFRRHSFHVESRQSHESQRPKRSENRRLTFYFTNHYRLLFLSYGVSQSSGICLYNSLILGSFGIARCLTNTQRNTFSSTRRSCSKSGMHSVLTWNLRSNNKAYRTTVSLR